MCRIDVAVLSVVAARVDFRLLKAEAGRDRLMLFIPNPLSQPVWKVQPDGIAKFDLGVKSGISAGGPAEVLPGLTSAVLTTGCSGWRSEN